MNWRDLMTWKWFWTICLMLAACWPFWTALDNIKEAVKELRQIREGLERLNYFLGVRPVQDITHHSWGRSYWEMLRDVRDKTTNSTGPVT